MKYITAYIPGLHEGYLNFFRRHQDALGLFVFGRTLISQFDYLRKDIRALDPILIVKAVRSWDIFPTVELLNEMAVNFLNTKATAIIMPDEPESHEIATIHFSQHLENGSIMFDSVFLRWDMKKSKAEYAVEANRTISTETFDREMMQRAIRESDKSIDWWRQIGAVIVQDDRLLMAAHNEPSTSRHYLHLFGDPRSNFKRGVSIELSVFEHAEAMMIAEAARQPDCSLEGASIYVTIFPCPPCAKLIARAGIKKLYFKYGYSLIDGEDVLRHHHVEIVRVQ